MPKTKLRKILPDHNKIKKNRALKIFGKHINKREIWSLNRKKILGGIFIGIFVAFIPMPFQMVLVAILTILFNVNFPIAFALIWLSNPVTMPFIYYFEYELGNILLNNKNAIEFSFEHMHDNLAKIALSLYTGTLLVCIVFSILSVLLVNFLWIKEVKKKRKKRA